MRWPWEWWEDVKAERERLAWYRIHFDEYNRWLAEFPEVVLVLENLRMTAEGREFDRMRFLPVGVGQLRERLRHMRDQKGGAGANDGAA